MWRRGGKKELGGLGDRGHRGFVNVNVNVNGKAESGNRKAEKGEGVRGLGFSDGGKH